MKTIRITRHRYGVLPVEVPNDLPAVDTSLIDQVRPLIWHLIPKPLKVEIKSIGDRIGSLSRALHWNLHYEILGGGCVAAAVPGNDGYVFHRRLEWDVGFTPAFRFVPLTPAGWVRYTPGFVGALSGCTPGWDIAMNASDFEPIDPLGVRGLPVAWVVREAIARGEDLEATVRWLCKQRVMRDGFVTLVGPLEAYWLLLSQDGGTTLLHKRYPRPLVVRNSMTEGTMDECGWAGASTAPYRAATADAWVLDQYLKPAGALSPA